MQIKGVKNPLTIIAVFAGLAEVSGTGVLPLLEKDVQHIYVWFLMAFPIILIGLFFATLNFNHRVLYAPSDFRDDEGFFRALTPVEQVRKFEREVAEIAETQEEIPGTSEQKSAQPSKTPETIAVGSLVSSGRKAIESKYALAEKLVHLELQTEFPFLMPNVAYVAPDGTSVEFDAVYRSPKGRTMAAFEIKLLTRPVAPSELFPPIKRLLEAVRRIKDNEKTVRTAAGILVIVTAFSDKLQEFREQFVLAIRSHDFAIDVRFYDFEELKAKHPAEASVTGSTKSQM